ncbi:reverse transcriptase domain-containing protein [Tanacetum coccineum]
MYLATSKENVSPVLMAERGKKQIPIYFVSRTLHGVELKYPELEKLILALVYAARKLRRRVFWGANEELSNGGSLRVIVYGYDGLPMQLVPYVLEPEYLEYLVSSDAEVPLEDQPLPIDASPTALLPGYVADSDPDEDPEEDPEEDHADYLDDRGDNDDEPYDDDDDDTDDEDEEPFEDEEEKHLALTDSFVVPVVDHVPSAGDTEAFETDESAPIPRSPQIRIPFAQTCLSRARKTVRLEPPMSPSMEARIAEYAAAPAPPSPPPSLLSPWSPTLSLIPLPPLPPPPSSLHLPLLVPTSLPLPSSLLPPLPVSLFIPPPIDYREDIPKAELPPRKRLCLTAPTSRYEVGESSTAAPRPIRGHRADYGFIGIIDVEAVEEVALTTLEGVNASVAELAAVQEQDTSDIYAVIEDTQDRQTRLFQRVDRLDSYPDVGLSYRLTGVTDDDIDCTGFITTGTNNMPPRRSSATARAAAAAAAATPMTAAAVEQLIEARVSQNLKQDVAYAMDWKALKKMMTVKYCPRGEIKKLEIELWNLKDGLPDMIRGNVMSYQPKTMEKAIEFANDQMDQKVLTIAERQAEQKRKLEFNAGNNQGHQQQNKRQNTRRAYYAGAW